MMTREILLKMTMDQLSRLPDHKLKEVADFAEFLLAKTEEQILNEGIQKLAERSSTYKFLEDEEDLYSVNDLKEKYK